MKNKPQSDAPGQVVLGCIVIGLGLLFLLDNMGLINVRYAFHFWPTILIIFGVLKIMQSRSPRAYFVGAAMILFGAALTLKYMGLIYFNWRTLWPLAIIGVGLAVVFKSARGQREREWRRPPHTSDMPDSAMQPKPVSLDKAGPDSDSYIDVTAILGGFTRRIMSADFRGGEVTAILGGCELDLRQSALHGEAVLHVFAMCGGITIKVPPDWSVVLQGTPILGGFEEKTIVPPDTSKRLVIRGYAIMGGLEVRN